MIAMTTSNSIKVKTLIELRSLSLRPSNSIRVNGRPFLLPEAADPQLQRARARARKANPGAGTGTGTKYGIDHRLKPSDSKSSDPEVAGGTRG